jgi:hypothetical protein
VSLDGGAGTFFRSLEAEDVSFRVPMAMLLEKKWDLPRIDAGMVKVELRSGGLGATASVPSTPDDVDDALASFDPPVVSAPAPKATFDAAARDPDLQPETAPVDARVLHVVLRGRLLVRALVAQRVVAVLYDDADERDVDAREEEETC